MPSSHSYAKKFTLFLTQLSPTLSWLLIPAYINTSPVKGDVGHLVQPLVQTWGCSAAQMYLLHVHIVGWLQERQTLSVSCLFNRVHPSGCRIPASSQFKHFCMWAFSPSIPDYCSVTNYHCWEVTIWIFPSSRKTQSSLNNSKISRSLVTGCYFASFVYV